MFTVQPKKRTHENLSLYELIDQYLLEEPEVRRRKATALCQQKKHSHKSLQLDEIIKQLKSGKHHKVVKIDFFDDNIGAEGVKKFAEALKSEKCPWGLVVISNDFDICNAFKIYQISRSFLQVMSLMGKYKGGFFSKIIPTDAALHIIFQFLCPKVNCSTDSIIKKAKKLLFHNDVDAKTTVTEQRKNFCGCTIQ